MNIDTHSNTERLNSILKKIVIFIGIIIFLLTLSMIAMVIFKPKQKNTTLQTKNDKCTWIRVLEKENYIIYKSNTCNKERIYNILQDKFIDISQNPNQ